MRSRKSQITLWRAAVIVHGSLQGRVGGFDVVSRGYLFIFCSYDTQESSEEYYPSISGLEDSKRNQARTGKRIL
jgi:hypothetical protein